MILFYLGLREVFAAVNVQIHAWQTCAWSWTRYEVL